MNKTECNCQCKTKAKKLAIIWQRLISDGSTCPRCGSTENELDRAVLQLKKKLNPLGIDVTLQKMEMTTEEFKKDPSKSNRILFNGRLLEDVVNAKTGSSQCCDVCGDAECRTLEYGNKSFETVPADIIIEAGLKVLKEKQQH